MYKHKRGVGGLLPWLVLAYISFWANTVFAAPTVLTMPDGIDVATKQTYYTWAGNPIYVWGRVQWGPTSTTGNFVLECGDGTSSSGGVTNQHDTGMTCTYATAGTYFAKLTVTDGNGDVASSTTRIDTRAVVDKTAQINLAIERGLKYLYDNYLISGLSGQMYTGFSYRVAQTASSLLAFELKGHTPGLDAAQRAAKEQTEIYAQLVNQALDQVLSNLQTQAIGIQPAGDPDANGNGIGLFVSSGRDPYTTGMFMMALVGTGEFATAGNSLAPVGSVDVNGRALNEIVQDLADYCSWAQVDPASGVSRGGWRYSANSFYSDNSAAQWCAIGMDEAEVQWNTVIPVFVKSENALWTTYSQHPTVGNFGYTSNLVFNAQWGVTESGAGIAQLSMQGVAQTDSKVIAAHTYINNNFTTLIAGAVQNIYGMYAVTKGMRAAKDASGARQTIDLIGTPATRDWYDAYASKLISTQLASGQWNDTYWVPSYIFETAWAIEILIPALSTPLPVAVAGGPYTVLANQDVDLDGCGSFHQNPSKFITRYEWDTDNDGAYDIITFPPICSTTVVGGYPDIGADYTQIVRLRVTDDDGITDEGVTTVNITTGNLPPVANPGGPYLGAIAVPVILDGSGSYDPNAGEPICGSIVRYEWDLDGNGSYETDGGAASTYTNVWATAYNGSIGLRVTDDCGLTGVAAIFAKISVSDIQPIVNSYNVVRTTRLSRFVFEYEVELALTNVGTGDATLVTADLIDFPANVTVIDGAVDMGTIAAGTTVTGADTFTIQVNRSIITSANDLRWRIQYTDAATTGSVDVLIPWLP